MYIQSDFMQEQQEDRRKKGSLTPWLIGGGLVAAGGVGLAMASKAGNKSAIAREIKEELVKKGTDDAKKLVNSINKKKANSEKVARRRKLLVEVGKNQEDVDRTLRVINEKQKERYIFNPLEKQLPSNRKINKRFETNQKIAEGNKEISNKARELAKQRGTEYMKYTTTANFAMAGALGGGIKTGVLNRITGQLGSTVDKAKSWLQKAKQTKQRIGSATIAKQRLMPPNAKAEAIARSRYGSSSYKENLTNRLDALARKDPRNTSPSNPFIASQKLGSKASLRTNLTAGSARQINRGSADRFAKSDSKASINDNRSLRVKYTKDPRTGKLVGAAYSKLSLLCDL